MSIIKNYEVKRIDDQHVLYVYIKPYFVEFAAEKGDLRKVETLKNEVSEIVNKKLKNTTVTACKIMLGSVLLATIPATQLPAYAAATTSVAEEVTSAYTNYTVKSGDTLWKIANAYGISIQSLQKANNLNYTTIYVDQILRIPSSDYQEYVVQSGDTLWRIANNNSTTIDRIKTLNNLGSDIIYPGQSLILDKAQGTTKDTRVATPTTHTVAAGDTLWKISIEYDLAIDDIKAINGLTSDNISVGQVLQLTGEATTPTDNTEQTQASVEYITYKVQSGDNLWTIAIDYKIPMSELMSANNFSMDTALSIGQEITVPVHIIPAISNQVEGYGEYMDWWEGAQYVFAINEVATVTDVETGTSFTVKRTIGANHADCEPLTSLDTAIAKDVWGGYSWETRAVIVEVDGREIAASMSFMPHDIQYINDNGFDGHFDIHFLNSTRHVDGQIDDYHQDMIKVAAGLTAL